MSIDLSKLTPAPWRVSDKHGLCVVRDDPIGDVVCDLSVGQWEGSRADAEFIALSRNALDVMARRKWSPMYVCEYDHNDEDHWGWKAFSSRENGYVGSNPAELYDDPYTALVEADAWYAANVEGKP